MIRGKTLSTSTMTSCPPTLTCCHDVFDISCCKIFSRLHLSVSPICSLTLYAPLIYFVLWYSISDQWEHSNADLNNLIWYVFHNLLANVSQLCTSISISQGNINSNTWSHNVSLLWLVSEPKLPLRKISFSRETCTHSQKIVLAFGLPKIVHPILWQCITTHSFAQALDSNYCILPHLHEFGSIGGVLYLNSYQNVFSGYLMCSL